MAMLRQLAKVGRRAALRQGIFRFEDNTEVTSRAGRLTRGKAIPDHLAVFEIKKEIPDKFRTKSLTRPTRSDRLSGRFVLLEDL